MTAPCRHCGEPEWSHGYRWTTATGWHTWTGAGRWVPIAVVTGPAQHEPAPHTSAMSDWERALHWPNVNPAPVVTDWPTPPPASAPQKRVTTSEYRAGRVAAASTGSVPPPVATKPSPDRLGAIRRIIRSLKGTQ